MPNVPPLRRALPLSAALLAAALATAPGAFAQQYAVPAGEPIVLDGGATAGGPVYGEPVVTGQGYGYDQSAMSGQNYGTQNFGSQSYGGQVGGGATYEHVGGPLQSAYRPTGGGETFVPPGSYGGGGEGYVFDDPGAAYGGTVYGGTVCGEAGCGCDAGGCDGGFLESYGGLHETVCGACGTTGCTPGTCDPSCTGELACGGPVVCNKFGRCGKFYNTAVTRQRCGLSAGYAFLFLRPEMDSATAAVTRRPNAGGGLFSNRRDFNFDLESGSRIFVEMIRPDSMGVRATYTGFDADAALNATVVPGGFVTSAAVPAAFAADTNSPSGTLLAAQDGDTLLTRSEVEFDTLDLEATRRLRAGCWLLNTGGGVRFAALDQRYQARVAGPTGGLLVASTEFEGGGPTAFAEARRPIGQTGFALLGSGRVSLLVGGNDSRATLTQAGVTNRGFADRTDFVPVGELQLGGEWSAWVNPNTLFFTQIAYEGQLWSNLGGPSAGSGDVAFNGFNVSVGLEW